MQLQNICDATRHGDNERRAFVGTLRFGIFILILALFGLSLSRLIYTFNRLNFKDLFENSSEIIMKFSLDVFRASHSPTEERNA